MTVGPIVIESAKGPRFWPIGACTDPHHYDIDQLATRLRRKVEVHVCSRDFPREAIVFLEWSPAARPIGQKVVCIRQNGGGALLGRRHQRFQRDCLTRGAIGASPPGIHPISR